MAPRVNRAAPIIKIVIAGAFSASAREFEVTVDTGFTGFISMPIMNALPLGLPLYGTTSVQFADGKTADRFTALGVATLGNESEAGIVILEPSATDVLVGMEFLTKFKKSLLVYRGMIFLVDETELDKGMKAIFDQHQASQSAIASSAPTQKNPSDPQN